ncbi:DNA-binding protein [Methylobacterium sp. C25]|uniref:DNA-binding protein n=1 Tax=Methylobacterium sp. C25 TaxID=2721622 RepID=UPI001F318E98|nr:DNA-binding protein [Methylobacterium sp. C25]
MSRSSVPAGACLIFLLAILPAAAASRIAPDSCRASDLREDRLDAVGRRGELVLGSGTRAILDGIHWPETEPDAAQAAAYLAGFRGRELAISQRGEADRWGRARIDAVVEPTSDADEPADLATGLVAAGLAHADAGESDLFCRADLIALEGEPRLARRGVWRDPVLDARDGPALATQAGRFVVAEGRIVGVGERTERTYLDFVRRSADGLTVTVTKRTWRIMRERGLTAATLRGRLARVRGRLEVRRGPVLEIVSTDMLEVLEGERALTR